MTKSRDLNYAHNSPGPTKLVPDFECFFSASERERDEETGDCDGGSSGGCEPGSVTSLVATGKGKTECTTQKKHMQNDDRCKLTPTDEDRELTRKLLSSEFDKRRVRSRAASVRRHPLATAAADQRRRSKVVPLVSPSLEQEQERHNFTPHTLTLTRSHVTQDNKPVSAGVAGGYLFI